jgi:dTDP-4-dehydrorhamnose 3,5-epimerase
MDITTFDIPGPVLFTPRKFGDDRGFFSEVWRDDICRKHIGDIAFVQDNHAFSARRGTLRGLHFQAPPMAQGKLLRVSRGAVFDVAVDARHGSPTFGRHVAVELSAANWAQLWVPEGFLHGYCTLTDGAEVLYKVTRYYSPAHDGGVVYNDPDLAIAWPIEQTELTLSPKDVALPRLRDIPPVFRYMQNRP